MNNRDQLIAYIATLSALVLVFAIASIVASLKGATVIDGLAVGTVLGGLIGVLRIPTRAGVNVEQADQVGPNGPQTQTPPTS